MYDIRIVFRGRVSHCMPDIFDFQKATIIIKDTRDFQ